MKNDFAVITKSADETVEFGKKLSSQLKQGDVVSLYGDLGSGKTQLVKGICLGLGVKQTVNSPTFIIVNEYSSTNFPAIYHFDLYRMKSQDEILETGFQDYLAGNSITLIEWPEKIEDLLPENTVIIRLAHTAEDEHSRWIKLEKNIN